MLVLNFILVLLWTGRGSLVSSVAFLGFLEAKWTEKRSTCERDSVPLTHDRHIHALSNKQALLDSAANSSANALIMTGDTLKV
jgi:hypothetical protein